MKKVVIIIQARTGSTRLPNKVLTPINNEFLLTHCIKRLKNISNQVPVIVATTHQKNDDEIVNISNLEKVDCYRGSETDVLDRYYKTAIKFKAKYIIRATADNPLVDIDEAGRLIYELKNGNWDYVTMVENVNGNALPIGAGLEGFTIDSLEKSYRNAITDNQKEHVNEYILENPQYFKIKRIKCKDYNNCPRLRLTIDTKEDLKFIKKIASSFPGRFNSLRTEEIIKWWV